jgi:Ca2+-binding EF-hand superfamily protein
VDGSGQVDYTEWALGTSNKDMLFTEPKLKQAFALFDSDNSGRISLAELKQMMAPMVGDKMTDAEWKKMMKEIDKNGDGSISYDEFKVLISSTFSTLNARQD